MNMNDIFFHLLRLDIKGREKQPEITTTAMNIQSSLEDPRAIYNCQILLLFSLSLSLSLARALFLSLQKLRRNFRIKKKEHQQVL